MRKGFAVDLSQAFQVMNTPARVQGVSDLQLIGRVQSELDKIAAEAVARRVAPPPMKPLVQAVGVGGGIDARPVSAMLRLARATRPPTSDDVYDWYKHWAWLRYLGVFAVGGSGNLKLDQLALRVKGNQRRVMSEELGVGFGVLVAESWCRQLGAIGSITVVDVDLALNDPGHWPHQRGDIAVRSRQPDYLLTYTTAGGLYGVKTLECKGASAAGGVSKQLARAATQLACLELDGNVPQGIAVATVSNGTGVTYHAVDPEDGGRLDAVRVTEEDLHRARRGGLRRGDWKGVRTLPASDVIAASLVDGMGSLADYAGNEQAATRLLPEERPRWSGRRRAERTEIPTDVGTFVGVEHQLPTPDGRPLRVFMGVDADVDAALAEGEPQAVREAQERFQERRGGTEVADDAIDQSIRGISADEAAAATSPEGATLILRV